LRILIYKPTNIKMVVPKRWNEEKMLANHTMVLSFTMYYIYITNFPFKHYKVWLWNHTQYSIPYDTHYTSKDISYSTFKNLKSMMCMQFGGKGELPWQAYHIMCNEAIRNHMWWNVYYYKSTMWAQQCASIIELCPCFFFKHTYVPKFP
jgi:hypothetical protein